MDCCWSNTIPDPTGAMEDCGSKEEETGRWEDSINSAEGRWGRADEETIMEGWGKDEDETGKEGVVEVEE